METNVQLVAGPDYDAASAADGTGIGGGYRYQ